ncbi:hypothetical protein [Erythrobacter sp.]|uniref:hypothetical protein n=1 Tax=Erythrobacter sp. TaxID=1042 RepID=UPI001425EE2F|nr:hypothetical protein [Erythrobacter sp.]QIQ86116.1 MAG: hypothetical protein G9473_05005 [Erythrobacter sp.]
MTKPPFPLWTEEAQDAGFTDPAEIARRAGAFERTIRRRNLIEYAAGGIVFVLFFAAAVGALWIGEWAIASSFALILAGIALVVRNLARRAGNLERRPEEPCLVHLRRQYARQYAALRSVGAWYLAPLLPGLLLFYAVIAWKVSLVAGWREALSGIAGPFAVTFGVFAAILAANLLAARGLKRKLDALGTLD